MTPMTPMTLAGGCPSAGVGAPLLGGMSPSAGNAGAGGSPAPPSTLVVAVPPPPPAVRVTTTVWRDCTLSLCRANTVTWFIPGMSGMSTAKRMRRGSWPLRLER